MEKLAIGLLIGGVCGALLTANNCKMRELVKKGQEEVGKRVNDFVDEKIEMMETADAEQSAPTKTRKGAKKRLAK
jgi:hypothetical protein